MSDYFLIVPGVGDMIKYFLIRYIPINSENKPNNNHIKPGISLVSANKVKKAIDKKIKPNNINVNPSTIESMKGIAIFKKISFWVSRFDFFLKLRKGVIFNVITFA